MKKLAALLLMLAAPLPAHAEAAFALGTCDGNGGYPYGFSFDYASKAQARRTALSYCAKDGRGTDCKIVNDDLNLLCFAFAVDKSQQCGAIGIAYYDAPAQSKAAAIQQCREYGGKDCRVVLSKCDTGRPTTAGGGGGGGPIYTPPKDPQCYTGPTHMPRSNPWECH